MRLLAIAAVFFALTTPTTAEACRANQPPETRVRRSYDAVLVGVVERPSLGPRYGSEQGWSATVRVTGVIEGRSSVSRYVIGRTGQSSTCDDGWAMPRAGERWVVYVLRRSPGGPMTAAQSYPLSLARRIDPRFRD